MKSNVTHHAIGCATAAGTCALGVWVRAATDFEQDSGPLFILMSVSFGFLALGLVATRLSLVLPDRISPVAGGVVIRYRPLIEHEYRARHSRVGGHLVYPRGIPGPPQIEHPEAEEVTRSNRDHHSA